MTHTEGHQLGNMQVLESWLALLTHQFKDFVHGTGWKEQGNVYKLYGYRI